MLSLDTLSLFVIASAMLSIAPGPDNIFVLTQSALYGRRAGLLITLGLCSGLIVHTAAVALGVAAIFATSELAFNLLKWVGAAYLLYLAWQVFRAPVGDLSVNGGSEKSARTLFLRGVIMNITNPKVAIFFLAFLPQFAEPAQGNLPLQMLLLGGVFILTAWIIFSAIAIFAARIGHLLKSSHRAQWWMNKLAGGVFTGLAARLLFSEN